MLINTSWKCPCQSNLEDENDDNTILNRLLNLRDKCAALKEILIPDNKLEEFKKACSEEYDEANHRPSIILFFRDGKIEKITSPIHRYLLDETCKPRAELKEDYKNQLSASYVSKECVLERHQTIRKNIGKSLELFCSQWLEHQKWTLSNLAALGGAFDIETLSSEGTRSDIEIKFIGQEDTDFLNMIKNKADSFSSEKILNFLIFKVYEGLNN